MHDNNNDEGTTTTTTTTIMEETEKERRRGKNAVLVSTLVVVVGRLCPWLVRAKILRRFGRHEKIKIVRFQLAISSCPAPTHQTIVAFVHQSAPGDQAGTGTSTLP